MREYITHYQPARLNWAVIGFALSLLIPSTAVVQKYLGIVGVAFYIITALILLLGSKYVFVRLISRLSDKQVLFLIIATLLILLAIFWVGYPLANSGLLGKGSDRDEALNISTMELLRGHYPYYAKTYLGNPISPMPGSLLLAIPFVLFFGNSAYQNLFWLLAFLATANSYLEDKRLALFLLFMIITLSPEVLREFIVGGDFLANSIYVLLFVIWMVNTVSRHDIGGWRKSLLAVLLGLGLASRANFLLLLPLVFSVLVRNVGWKPATKYIAITCITFALLTLPFFLYDPQGFSPLHTANKLAQFQTILPFAGIVIPLVSGVIAVILSLGQDNKLPVLLRNCAIVLSLPVLGGAVLQSIAIGRPDFMFMGFGLSFLFFGALAFAPKLYENHQNTA